MLLKLYQTPPIIWCVYFKVRLQSNFLYSLSYFFVHNMTFLHFLAKFRSTMSIISNFLDFHFWEFTAAITPRFDCESEKITSNTQKYLTDGNNNHHNNECRKLHEQNVRSFWSVFLCLLLLSLLVGSTLTLSKNLLRSVKFSRDRFLQISLVFQ